MPLWSCARLSKKLSAFFALVSRCKYADLNLPGKNSPKTLETTPFDAAL